MVRALLSDMQAQRKAGVPEKERTMTVWAIHPPSNTAAMSVEELQTFIETVVSKKSDGAAESAMYGLRVMRGLFASMFAAVPESYVLPEPSKKRKAPEASFVFNM